MNEASSFAAGARSDPTSGGALAFVLLGGPLAWFAQLCAGYMLASWPCFPADEHLLRPLGPYSWTWPALVLLSVIAFVIAAASFTVARRVYYQTRPAIPNDSAASRPLRDRTCFLALWGMVFGGGFAVSIAANAIAYLTLPRCAG